MKHLSRRDFFRVSAFVAAASVAAACTAPAPQAPTSAPAGAPTTAAQPTAAPSGGAAAPAAPGKYSEAPGLAEQVQAGTLPPVEERLPLEPLVLEPVEEIGTYGGTWNYMAAGSGIYGWNMVNYVENFAKWNRDVSGHRPNLLSAWEYNEDASEITLHWREGMRWSDGEPLTARDWQFWWEDLVLDENFPFTRETGTFVKGEPMTFTLIDDYTVHLQFVGPNPLFIQVMCRGTGNRATSWQVIPSHYYKQYHYKYNTEYSASDTNDLVDRYNNRMLYPEIPHFGPWLVTEYREAERAIAHRNPYYWKVDPAGNQLPYIDSVEVKIVQSPELIPLSVIAGEVDFQIRQLEIADTPLLIENAEQGGYEVRMWKRGDCSFATIDIFYCYEQIDPGIGELFWNRNFRLALSHAIDRERINDVVFLGLSKPVQMTMFPDGPEFLSERGQQVLRDWQNLAREHDPDLAMSLLDEIGVVDVDGDGFRERPDGTRLELILDVGVDGKAWLDTMQLVKEDWAAVGLNLTLNAIDSTVMTQRLNTCQSMMRTQEANASGLFIAQSHWTPVENAGYSLGGYPYGLYYQSGGTQGIPVPEGSFLERLQQVYTDAITIVDEEERNNRILDGYQIHIDEGPIIIGTVGDTTLPVVVKKTLRNVQAIGGPVGSGVFGFPGTADPEQWFKTDV